MPELTAYIFDFFNPTKLKILLFIILTIGGVIWGITTFSPFEGSGREGSISTRTRIERKYVRPITIGPFLKIQDLVYNKYIASIVIILHYYIVTCILWFGASYIKAFFKS